MRTTVLADKLKPFVSPRLARHLVYTRLAVRQRTGRFRMLPDFLIIGAQRCGTSSLYKYLGWHPSIAPSLRKETGYFSDRFGEGQGWYRAHFPIRLQGRWGRMLRRRQVLAFEATPDYLLYPQSAARVAELLPNAKIIAMLRNPVDRAFSHYEHMVRLGLETLSFEQALDKEEDRLAGEFQLLDRDPSYPARDLRRFSYVKRGEYAEQLGAWMRHFPQEQMLVLRSEDFFADVARVYQEISGFLGVRAWQPRSYPNYSYPRGRQSPPGEMSAEMRRRLEETFAPHNQRLYELLARDLGW